jgi:AcrR family transcriptional regulator
MEVLTTRDKILEIAVNLFAENGITATTVRDIASAAEVNVAMISYYFGSKEQLIGEVFRNKMDEYNNLIQHLVEQNTSTYIEKVHNIVDYYVDQFFTKQSIAKILINISSLPSENQLHQLVAEFRTNNFIAFQKIIVQGQANNEFKQEVDLPLLMLTMTGTLFNNIASRNIYRKLHHFENMPDEQYLAKFKDILSHFFKSMFNTALLTKHESN